jgi:hypothetical protein
MRIILSLSLFLFIQNASAIVPIDAYTFDFNIKTIRMGRMKEDKLYRSVDLLRQIFASPEFKERILRHKYRGRYAFAQNKGLTNSQIYKKILEGVEVLHPIDNNAMDVEVELYSDYKSTVLGFTRPSTRRIWMNTKYFNRHTSGQLAANLTHEWLHKLGFDHERNWCWGRKYSVPYAIGYIVRDLARSYQ